MLQQPGNTVTFSNDFSFFGDGTDIITADTVFSLAGIPTAENLASEFAAGPVTFTGNDNDNIIRGFQFTDTITGGEGDDVYNVTSGDVIHENAGEGIDEARTTESYVLSANVENLTLLDGGSNTQDFEDMALGEIANGENGWAVLTPPGFVDQGVVVDPNDIDNQLFRISSDPSNGAFGGPYTPAARDVNGLVVTAGEPQTSAQYSGHSISFDFAAVVPGDNSRIEVDFARANATDRNNFMVIEQTAGGIRIAVSEPTTSGDFTTDNPTPNTFPNDWRQLVSHIDSTEPHHMELRLTYVDGANNDVIEVYLDGNLIGTTTTFENFRDAVAPGPGSTHADNAEANQTNRIIFRESNNGQPQDGSGTGQNQGFYFDNLTSKIYNDTSGTGNNDANVITGNSGDNTLSGLGGNDHIFGNDGTDTTPAAPARPLDGGAAVDTAIGYSHR